MKRLLFAVILALAGLGGAAALIARQALRPYRGYSGNVILTLEPGTDAASAARLLAGCGVLKSRLPFLALYALGRPRHRTLKAGEYLFEGPLSPRDVYWKLVHGDIYYHLVVIPEGSDRFDIARILRDTLGVDPAEFLQVTEQTASIHDLDAAALTLEGYLFPDSYRFPAGVSAATVALTMVARFRQVFDSRFQQQLGSSSQDLHDLVTLASLIEKETPDPVERPEIAGVFDRRLQRGMLLECDPTVLYAARLESGSGGILPPRSISITAAELGLLSPYNTYRHPGLPPGPICSPGAASLKAALDPAPGDALYFVSNLQGGHVFSRTLAEHQRNVARYRRAEAALHPAALQEALPAPPPTGRRPRRHSLRKTRKRIRSLRSGQGAATGGRKPVTANE